LDAFRRTADRALEDIKMDTPSPYAELSGRLQDFLAQTGQVANFQIMADGHAGLTFGFDLVGAAGDATPYILKKAPVGVPRSGSADIYRQSALLRTLHSSGFPAPAVHWAHSGDDVLGAPFIIMEKLSGRSVIVWSPSPAALAQFTDASVMWAQSARLMGVLHAFDWRVHIPSWQKPTSLTTELERWERLLRHMPDCEARARARALANALTHTIPDPGSIGLVHGDLQPGNVLFENGQASGLIDWDLAAIGPVGLDVGWLLMIADPHGWAIDWRPHAPLSRDVLLEIYYAAGGPPCPDVSWHQAFAHFRMAAITGLNLKLHRQGRRIDPIWERFYASVPFMLARGAELASSVLR
jgi:aminoglycoside phosphotransferase (APT) family kinase protein